MVNLIVIILLLILGYLFGRLAESRHYKRIALAEKNLLYIPTGSTRTLPSSLTALQSELVSGNVVVSVDYFKRILGALRSFFGGRVTSMESLLDRARREAIIRMKLAAADIGATIIFNVRLETSTISTAGSFTGSVEVLAYATAIVEKNPQLICDSELETVLQ